MPQGDRTEQARGPRPGPSDLDAGVHDLSDIFAEKVVGFPLASLRQRDWTPESEPQPVAVPVTGERPAAPPAVLGGHRLDAVLGRAIQGLGTPAFADSLRHHQSLHRSSVDRVFAQNEALVEAAAAYRDDALAAASRIASLEVEAGILRAAAQDAEARLAEALEAASAADDLARRLEAELRKAYALIDGQRQRADRFLSDALASNPGS